MELKSDNIQDRPEQQQQQMQQQQQEQQEQQHFHVLAVDDSVIDRKLLEKLLKVSSYQVTCVDSGDKALEYLGLLNNLDCHSTASSSSSSSSSSSCSQSSQQEGSSWKDVPVVIMSSENEPSRISMCLEGGAEEFLLKPLQLSDLDKIQAYLVKSLDHSCTNIDKDLIGDNNDNDDNSNNNYSEDSNNDNGNSNNSNNNFSKRKAISSEATERRPKMKGVAVIV
ncbi:two-component response regulator ORR9-like isoform X2 [Herrania umbratica]|uniref:Two-component response regulator ORR9-like isoform X2 n=1 Tax=Herrania umbratica TaxID=108875 RepID=A0A6J1AE05_9ROSI|nr:two-component response regulator ORR9-like isoform X2 [Herrania umbratica]